MASDGVRLNALEEQVRYLVTLPKAPGLVPLTTPLTSTSYDGNDTVAVGTVTIDTSAVFGAPVGIKAALVKVRCGWAAASGSSNLQLRPVGSGSAIAFLYAQTTFFQSMTVVVPCDANGDFDVVVANADALNVTIEIWGYWR